MRLFRFSKEPRLVAEAAEPAGAPTSATDPPSKPDGAPTGTDQSLASEPPAGLAKQLEQKEANGGSPPAVPTPPPAPPAETIPRELIEKLSDKIGQLAGTADAERQAVKRFSDKVQKMEDRLELFQILFESLSLKYNPFVGKEEREAFDGRAPLPDEPSRPAASAVAPFAAPAVMHLPDSFREVVPTARETMEAKPSSHNGAPSGPQATPAREGAVPQAPPADAEEAPPAPLHRSPYGEPARHSQAPAFRPAQATPHRTAPWEPAPLQGARESYLALAWFERLYRHLDPQTVHRILDHYLELGWIPPDAHHWLRTLAYAIAPPADPEKSPSSSKNPTPLQIVRIHKSSLRFFDHLFRFSLDAGESRHLERAVASLTRRGRNM